MNPGNGIEEAIGYETALESRIQQRLRQERRLCIETSYYLLPTIL